MPADVTREPAEPPVGQNDRNPRFAATTNYSGAAVLTARWVLFLETASSKRRCQRSVCTTRDSHWDIMVKTRNTSYWLVHLLGGLGSLLVTIQPLIAQS